MPYTNDFPIKANLSNSSSNAAKRTNQSWHGEPLRPILLFLSIPASMMLAMLLFSIHLPIWLLYGIASGLGLVIFLRMFRDPEWLMAVAILYIPLNKLYVIPIAPAINGTNLFLILLIIAWIFNAKKMDRPLFIRIPSTKLVELLIIITMLSLIPTILNVGSWYVIDHLDNLKRWLEQFILFFSFINLIKDGAMARRIALYMMLGMLIVLVFGTEEWLDKRFASSIEKSRLLGPQLQPNDFAAFLVYSMGLFVSLFVLQIRKIRAWFLLPLLFLFVKLLIATFSRGAYFAVALIGLVTGYLRGIFFVIIVGAFSIILLIAMPELFPESIKARLSQTASDSGDEKLDNSSQTRLILWRAAIAMSMESPLLGKGFATFPMLKSSYTEVQVPESDNHNMYLYLASQMGIPASLIFILILYHTYQLGVRVYRGNYEIFPRAIGMGGAAMAVGVAMTNMFGSRMVDIVVTAYFWIYLAVLNHLWIETQRHIQKS
ncbi:MAG: O-antigen ligase family protein [Candidatus Competibacter sp.]